MADNQRVFGIVREFNMTRGRGLIDLEGSNGNGHSTPVLVRYSAIHGEGIRTLYPGQRVSFELEQDSLGLNALRVIGE